MSKKWVIILDRRQDCGPSASGPAAQDRYCTRGLEETEETAWKRKRIETSLVIVIVILHVLTKVVCAKLFWN